MKSWLEISADRLAANFRAVRQAAGEDFEVLAVIKANGYGHGATVVAPVLCRAGARWLGVTDVEEGVRVRQALDRAGFPDARLLVMCGLEPEDTPQVVQWRLCPVVWTAAHLDALAAAVREAGAPPLAVQVEIDSGMSRQGVATGSEAFAALLEHAMRLSQQIEIEGIMSHLCCSEVHGCERTTEQEARFGRAQRPIEWSGWTPRYWHLANTSGVDEGSTLELTRRQAAALGAKPMVRTGLAIFGYTLPLGDGGEHHLEPLLEPIATWKTRVIDLREIAAGTSVGYGATFMAQVPMRLALLPVGYADGFRRGASSGVGDGWVMVGGRRAPVVGRVSMNLTVVDVTGIPVAVGDEAVLLGEGVTAHDHARWNATIPYEILCGLRTHHRLL